VAAARGFPLLQLSICRLSRAAAAGSSIAEGSSVVLVSLQQRQDLNGEVGIALTFSEGRYKFCLRFCSVFLFLQLCLE
jgi:hypothetical protein